MTEFEHLIPSSDLKITLLTGLIQSKREIEANFHYDPLVDAFTVLVVSPETDLVAHYMNENLAFLYRADDLEIVGLQVEGFERSFVPKHQNVQQALLVPEEKTSYQTFAEMVIATQRMIRNLQKRQRTIAEEVFKATEDVLGEPGRELAEALEFA